MLKTRTVETFENKVLFCFVFFFLYSFQTRDCPLKRGGDALIKVNAEVPSSSDLNSCLLSLRLGRLCLCFFCNYFTPQYSHRIDLKLQINSQDNHF